MKIFPQPAVFSPVFIALTGFSAFLKMFLVFFLPDIYCKLNLSPEWPSRNFHCVPVFLVKCCCVCKLEFLSENLLLRKKKKKARCSTENMDYVWKWGVDGCEFLSEQFFKEARATLQKLHSSAKEFMV